jgi:uncharacterized membrane protein YvlD (DUF360 family)
MGTFEQKSDVLNQIAALKSVNTDFPKLKKNKSLKSLNAKKKQTIEFIKDVIDILVGIEEFKDELVRFLTYQSPAIEGALKLGLKSILKSKFSCSTDATIPSFLIDGFGTGFNIAVKQVDFFSILKVDPNSVGGKLIYGSISQDLNAYLYDVLQGNVGTWKNLIIVSYQQQGIVDGKMKTNVFNVKIDSSWNGRTVNDFINAFLDAIIILTIPVFINKVFDMTYGSVSNLLKFNKKTVSADVELEILVQKIIDFTETVEINDSYFDFTKDEIDFFEERVEERVSGKKILKECDFVSSSIDVNDIVDLNEQLNNASTLIEIKDIITNKFNTLANQATDNVGDENKAFGKNNFFKGFLLGIVKALANLLFAPKTMMLIIGYFKIVSNTIGFTTFGEFLRENRQLIIDLVKKVLLPIVIKFLMKILTKHLTKLVEKELVEKNKEKIKNQITIIKSLLGISNETLGLLTSLT